MRPVSTTKATSSMVIAVSAMFVARTTFLVPLGGLVKTSRCSSGGIVEWIGRTQSLAGDPRKAGDANNNSCTVVISFIPGRNTRMAELVVS